MEIENSEVDLLKDRINALEKRLEKSESAKKSRKVSIRKISDFILSKLLSRDNIGLFLSLVSLAMSSCVVGYLVLK